MQEAQRPKPKRASFNLSRLAIRYSWLTVSFWIAVTVAGILAFSSLKFALFPDVTFPVVIVNTAAPLSSAVDTEAKVTQPIEQRLKSLEGLDDIRSSSYPGQSVVSLSFAVGTNLETANQEVKDALNKLNKTSLPDGATFDIIPLNLNESAVVSYALKSEQLGLNDLTQIAQKQILPAISKLPGVLRVSLLGDSSTGTSTTLVRFNGTDALAFQVIKRGNANTLEVVEVVEKQVGSLRSSLKNVQITLAATQAEYIRKATDATVDSLIEAIVLAVIVIFPFLRNWPATIISALAIPMSLLGTFIVMAIFGFNLETITLLALALVIGSIIDDAIVDVENIMRHLEEAETPREAALTATSEIGLTVAAATFTAVAVFLPIGLMGGVIGQFFKPFGITVSAAMLISLLVARTLSPVLAIYWIKKPQNKRPTQTDERKWGFFAQVYQNILKWSLNHRRSVIALALLSFVGAIALVGLIPKGFIPKLDRGEFNITYAAPIPDIQQQRKQAEDLFSSFLGSGEPNVPVVASNPLNESLEVAKKLEETVRKSPDVETVFTTVGSREGEPNKGILYIKLKNERKLTTAQLQEQFRSTLPKLPGVTTSVEDIQFVDTGGQKPLQVAIQGNDLKSLNDTAEKIKQRLEKLPGFVDVSTSGERNKGNDIFQIERLNHQRVAYINANLGKDLSLGDATDKLVAETKKLLPPNVTLDLGGDSASLREVMGSFGTTLILSALCIIGVLIWLFRTWVDPVVIGISLPLALVGAVIALLVTGSDFGMISLIGFVFLLGISNKNAIILVDYINQLRDEGFQREEAILQAGPVRYRPIIMTTVATILGMVPIALGFGAGSELRSPMAVAIGGGLISTTVLSLIVVPVLYTILDDWFPRKVKSTP
ncbi:MAG: efflux RND transporter permease subunit [Scytonematopsis contorta HA4267-MV1]|jgi:multidrug efflux pump subunit AcrB|nr:efflux RND transporter permease subunit [Scytonematopsis contorta HA4267-MV1]